MADLQRIEAQPVAVDLPLQGSPLPALKAQASEKLASTITSLTSQAVDWMDKESSKNAQKDAAQLVDNIGKGVVPAPSSFSAPGWFNTRSYDATYKSTAEALYFQQSADAYSGYGDQMRARYPLEPAKVAEEMEKKKTEMLSVMGADYKPYMSVRFNGIQAQHVSGVNVARDNDNRQQKGIEAQRGLDTWINTVATSAKWGGRIDTETANATAAFHQEMFDKEVAPLLRENGKSPQDIANIRQEAIDNAQIYQIQQHFADTGGLVMSAGGTVMVDPGKVAEWNEQINHMFAGEPNMLKKRAAARAGIQDAASIASGKAQSVQLRQNGAVQDAVLDASKKAQEAKVAANASGKIDPVVAAQEKSDYLRSVLDTMTRQDMSVSNKMQLIGGLDHAWGGLNQTNQEYFQAQVMKLSAASRALGDGPGAEAARNDAQAQMKTLTENPVVMSVMAPAIQAHALNSVDDAARRRAGVGWEHGKAEMMQGNLSTEAVRDMRDTMTADGRLSASGYGLTTPQEFETLARHNAATSELKAQRGAIIGQGLKDIQGGQIPSEQARELIGQVVPFADGSPNAFSRNGNISTPEGMAAARAYISTYKTMPPSVMKQLNESAFLGGDQSAAQMYKDIYQATVDAVSTGTDMVSQAGAMANAEKLMGDRAARIGRAVQQGTVENAHKLFQTSQTGSTSRNAGESETAASAKYDKVVTATMDDITSTINQSGLTRAVLPQSQLQKKIVGMSDPHSLMSTAGSATNIESKNSGTRIDPAVRSIIEPEYLGIVSTYGSLDATFGGDKQKQAMMTAIVKHSDKLEIAPDPDNPGGSVVQFKGTRALAAKMVGKEPADITNQVGVGIWAGLSQQQIDSGLVKLPPGLNQNMIRWEDTEARMYRTATGRMRIQVSAPVGGTYSKASAKVPLYDIDADSPLLSGVGAAITQHAASAGQLMRSQQNQTLQALTGSTGPSLTIAGVNLAGPTTNALGWTIGHVLQGGYAIYNGLFSDLQYNARLRQEVQAGADRPNMINAPWSFVTDTARRIQEGTALHSDARTGAIPETVMAYKEKADREAADLAAHQQVLDNMRQRRLELLRQTSVLPVAGGGH